jgi:hypothetical protein
VFKCPAEENANYEKSQLINARKNCEKTDIKTNKIFWFIRKLDFELSILRILTMNIRNKANGWHISD